MEFKALNAVRAVALVSICNEEICKNGLKLLTIFGLTEY